MTNIITRTQLNQWVKEIASIINYGCGSDGESKDFSHDFWIKDEVFTANISYRADVGTDDEFNSWWKYSEHTYINDVTDGNGNSRIEIARALEERLN
jgi:hypothetical protein